VAPAVPDPELPLTLPALPPTTPPPPLVPEPPEPSLPLFPAIAAALLCASPPQCVAPRSANSATGSAREVVNLELSAMVMSEARGKKLAILG
jgi:hypothetical protein